MVQVLQIRIYTLWVFSEIDNDAYRVCTHNFSPCTHRNIRPVRTMYTVKISVTQTVYDLMRTQIKIPLKLSQNDNLYCEAALSTIEK